MLRREAVIARSGSRLVTFVVAGAISIAVAAALAAVPRLIRGSGGSLVDIARETVKEYRYQAYPSWLQAHPDRTCPGSLDELNDFTSRKDLHDPWGGTYVMHCACGIVVESPGEDGKFGTADDIRSPE